MVLIHSKIKHSQIFRFHEQEKTIKDSFTLLLLLSCGMESKIVVSQGLFKSYHQDI